MIQEEGHIEIGRNTHTWASDKIFNASSAANFWGDSTCLITHVPLHPHLQFEHLENVLLELTDLE